MSYSQVNSLIIFIIFLSGEFNANVAKMMKMWDIATSNQGGRGLASFVGTMNWCLFKIKVHMYVYGLEILISKTGESNITIYVAP